MPPTLNQLLKEMVAQGGSDLHVTTNSPPQIRVTATSARSTGSAR